MKQLRECPYNVLRNICGDFGGHHLESQATLKAKRAETLFAVKNAHHLFNRPPAKIGSQHDHRPLTHLVGKRTNSKQKVGVAKPYTSALFTDQYFCGEFTLGLAAQLCARVPSANPGISVVCV
jgi:hypothetical protein